VFTFRGPKTQILNFKFHQMDFWFQFIDIHMNGKKKTCHDCHGFKWQNINIYQILIISLCGLMPFLARWIVIAPTYKRCSEIEFQI